MLDAGVLVALALGGGAEGAWNEPIADGVTGNRILDVALAADPDGDGPLVDRAHLERLFEVAPAALAEEGVFLDGPAGRPMPERFGAEGSRRWTLFGGGGVQPADSENRFIVAGLGHSWFLADDLSIDVELNGLYVDQTRKDSFAINTNLMFRWHFYSDVSWSLFFDGGAGLFVATDEVPASGSSFNFTPQAGGGITFEVAPDVRMVIGARWHHISNASLYTDNPGRDSLMGYAGVTWPF